MEVSQLASPLKYVLLFAVLVLVQVLICSNILLFGVAVPFLFIYFIIVLPLKVSLNVLMVLSFLLGLIIDLFCDCPGLNSMACLLLSVVKKPLFYAYMPKEDKFINAVPCISTMGWVGYCKYIITLCAIFSLLVFCIELFSFASFGRIILMAAASALFTFILILATDSLVNK